MMQNRILVACRYVRSAILRDPLLPKIQNLYAPGHRRLQRYPLPIQCTFWVGKIKAERLRGIRLVKCKRRVCASQNPISVLFEAGEGSTRSPMIPDIPHIVDNSILEIETWR